MKPRSDEKWENDEIICKVFYIKIIHFSLTRDKIRWNIQKKFGDQR